MDTRLDMARLRSALTSLEDRNLDAQGSFAVKLLIDKLQTAQQAQTVVKELAAGLERCGRSGASHRCALLSYLLATQRHLSPVRALPHAIPNLVAYLKRQHHSTNHDDLATLGCRMGHALAASLTGRDGGQQGGAGQPGVGRYANSASPAYSSVGSSGRGGARGAGVSDTRPLLDRRGSGFAADALGASMEWAGGGVEDVTSGPFVAEPAWVLNQVLMPLLRLVCRCPERDAMAAASALMVPLVDAMGRELGGSGEDGRSGDDVAAVLTRLLGSAFTLLGSPAAGTHRSPGALQLFASCAQAMGARLEADAAKRMLLAATSGLDAADDWQSLEAIRHDKIPAVRSAYQAAAAAVAGLPAPHGSSPAAFDSFAPSAGIGGGAFRDMGSLRPAWDDAGPALRSGTEGGSETGPPWEQEPSFSASRSAASPPVARSLASSGVAAFSRRTVGTEAGEAELHVVAPAKAGAAGSGSALREAQAGSKRATAATHGHSAGAHGMHGIQEGRADGHGGVLGRDLDGGAGGQAAEAAEYVDRGVGHGYRRFESRAGPAPPTASAVAAKGGGGSYAAAYAASVAGGSGGAFLSAADWDADVEQDPAGEEAAGSGGAQEAHGRWFSSAADQGKHVRKHDNGQAEAAYGRPRL
ncbi:hypothetical protein GPECTOR_12g442 [Gonium pectorale]|uniref:Uncharacterized protein n=1 Tax=Gonium pectorale TaxID=33097 RepID=A0A150GNS3_GONPE|nr:hypothetical protein GPECTOR_12g442 [Gonium pectorale]|eukprot:KXZ51479.1 hypothetical protein GPECTOR_12g442 [Gonium pectorale]